MKKSAFCTIRLLIFATLFWSFSIQAQVRLFVVHTENTLAPLVVVAKSHETVQQAWQRYLKNLEKHADLMELFAGRNPHLEISSAEEITQRSLDKTVLLLANLPKDYTQDSLRVEKFQKSFALEGQQSLILPIAAGLGLNLAENQEFLKIVSEKFPFMVAMGGDDVDPAKYGKENLHSRNVVPTRDRYEIQVIKSYVQTEKGFLLGVCRGSQISAVALGYKMHQHVPFHIGTDVAHGNDWHDIKLLKTNHNILMKLAPPEGTLHVNSLHHQAVRYHEDGPLQIAARSQDGVTEALEFKNGRGLLLQFHPELMDNALGEEILKQIVQHKSRLQIGSCKKVF